MRSLGRTERTWRVIELRLTLSSPSTPMLPTSRPAHTGSGSALRTLQFHNLAAAIKFRKLPVLMWTARVPLLAAVHQEWGCRVGRKQETQKSRAAFHKEHTDSSCPVSGHSHACVVPIPRIPTSGPRAGPSPPCLTPLPGHAAKSSKLRWWAQSEDWNNHDPCTQSRLLGTWRTA